MKDFTIQRERFVHIVYELPKLLTMQYEEVVTDKDGFEDNADFERYIEMEKLGAIHCITVRKGSHLIGYFINMVVYHLHHKGMITSSSDLFYIHPGYRKGTGLGLALFRAGINEMKKLGVKKMYVAAKKDTGLCRILKGFKFRHIEDNFSLKLGE